MILKFILFIYEVKTKMAFIQLKYKELTCNDKPLTILVFTEGTVIGPLRLWDWFNFKKYAPLKNCVAKLRTWENQGAKIYYLTSRKNFKTVNQIVNLLKNYGFPGDRLYYRVKKERYKDIAEAIIPAVLIEDDCKSIGGKRQMTITYIRKDIKSQIKSIVVKEFTGIDHLPDDICGLLDC
jgi:hypothetical protein